MASERSETNERPGSVRLAVPVVVVFILGAVLRLPTFGRPMLSDDEAIYATTADALSRGDLLYRDVVDHKPPLIYHVYQAGFALFGPYNTHGAHALVVLSVLLTAGFLLAIGRREPTRGVGLAAAALFLVFSTTWHDYDALAANCELFLLAPQTAAVWLLLRELGRSRSLGRAWLFHLAVGALVGASALFKYQGLTLLGASVGMLLWWKLLGRASWSRTMALALCQVVGAILPFGLYILGCAAAGNASDAIYWFEFNFSYVGAGLSGFDALLRGLRRLGLVGGAAFVPYSLGLWAAAITARGIVRVLRRPLRGPEPATTEAPSPAAVLALFWLCTSTFALCTGGRFFGHYFHLILPPLCLLAGPMFVRLWSRRRAVRATLVLLCALPALVFFALASFARPLAAALDEGEPAYEDVATRMANLTTAKERVFVWGNSPQIYVLARRPMGARFSFCNYMTGESPGTPTQTGAWNADKNQLPAAWDMLFSDLDQRRPSLIVDAAAAGWDGYNKFPISRYPRLRSYLDEHYRAFETRSGVVLYSRLPYP